MHLITRSASGLRRHPRFFIGGASLIEVLVSIVIASIGLLALAGVNAASLRYTKMSQYRATAAQLANDIGERMRANKGQAAVAAVVGPPAVPEVVATGFFAGDYDFTTDFAGQATKATLPSGNDLCNSSAIICTPTQIAALDLAQWRILVRDQLPSGSVFLMRQAGQVAMDLWVVWRDPAVANNDESTALTTECPDDLNRGDDPEPASIRCSFFRINL
jgi:type IV pilus assembly protein PilV